MLERNCDLLTRNFRMTHNRGWKVIMIQASGVLQSLKNISSGIMKYKEAYHKMAGNAAMFLSMLNLLKLIPGFKLFYLNKFSAA